jgi:hypothetical protein
MLLILTNYIYLLILGACLACSLIGFRRHRPHLQLFSVLLALTVVTEIFANLASGPLAWKTNYPIYNTFMLPEYCLYTLFFKAIIRNATVKRMLDIFLLIILAAWVTTNFGLLKISVWNSYMILIGDTLTIFMAAYYLSEFVIADEEIPVSTSTEFWIAASIFMYSACEIPITGRLNYLTHDETAIKWLVFTLDILNIIMFLTIIYAYRCSRLINIMSSWLTALRGF